MNKAIVFPNLADYGNVIIPGGYGFVTPFVLVYGTLRKGAGNYKRILKDFSIHHGTYRLTGFCLRGITCYPCENQEVSTVVDLFEIAPDRNTGNVSIQSKNLRYMYEINYMLDRLEQVLSETNLMGYQTLVFQINDPRQDKSENDTVFCKFYINYANLESKMEDNPTGDYMSPKEFINYPKLIL